MLSVRNLRKVYRSKKAEEVVALDGVSIDFPETGFVFLLGKSGSGKSTLLNAIGGLDKFDGGEIIIKGKSSADFSQADFDSYRNTFIGFIFQEYNILENFSVAKNLALALELQGKKADHEEVMKLLRQVEMEKYAKRKPNELSGGQKQRVAIARALIKNPEIIMADEPTGALDSNTGKQVMDTLKELSKTKLIIVVSHDREFAELYGDRIIELKDGRILHDVTKKEIVAQETKSGIKVIDNDIVYIKKGQEITPSEMKAITDIINERSKDGDAFISFNGPANEKLKEGAKINDSGNKEKFVDTEKEDIKIKEYNPNSLKLIKSRLKFSDSFKMGASALKNKVGKLIFTIFLSFLAFTVFGIFDALSCWNRAESVYEGMKISEATTATLTKQTQRENSKRYADSITTNKDLQMLQEKFDERTIKGVVGSDSNGIYDVRFGSESSFNVSGTSDPLYSTNISGFVYFTEADLKSFGMEKIKGRLPEADDEIAISKFTMDALIKLTSTSQNENYKITEDNIIGANPNNILSVWLDGFGSNVENSGYAKIVGIIDTKVDYSKYSDMESSERSNGMNSYMIQTFFRNSLLQMAFISEEKYNAISETGVDTYVSLYTENGGWGFGKESLQSIESYVNNQNLSNETNSDCKYYTYAINDEFYRLEYLDGGYSDYWNIYQLTLGDNYSQTRVYSYTVDTETLQDEHNQTVTDMTAFNLKFGELNSEKIPSKFTRGYTSKAFVVEEDIIYYKNGSLINSQGVFTDIPEDSIILEDYIADNILGVDYEEGIAQGHTIDLEISGKTMTFKIVGVSRNHTYFSNKCLNEDILSQFDGCSKIIASMTGDDASDKKFILFCENGIDGDRWIVQNSTTSVLDMLEDIIVEVAQIFFYIAIGFAVFASLMLMNFITTSISYKKREIGVLRALGARGSDIFGIFFNESLIIAFINFVLSATATIAVCLIINSVLVTELGMDITLLIVGIRQIVLLLAVSVASAFVGSFLPTFKISRKRPIDAINNR